MPRGVNNWSAEDVVRFVRARGFVFNHAKGSHYFYIGKVDGSLRQICIPFHGSKSLKPRTVKGIILQSGIPMSEWVGKYK
jgi:predicted RNA binding protein YcfA (HicA-like mRNA interferase family)